MPSTSTPVPSPAPANPLALAPSQLSLLGSSIHPFVLARHIVLQRFANGIMVVFAKTDKGFDVSGGEYIFAMGKDGRAWRIADEFVETSKHPDSWYTCDAKPGLRPERSGVPWRGFGKAWCDYPDVKTALGAARGYEEAEIEAAFQSFERGRAFRVPDWRGIPGWDNQHTYIVYYSGSLNPRFTTGRWE